MLYWICHKESVMSVGASINVSSQRISLSKATLVCGLLSFVLGLLIAIPGIIIGHTARSKIKDNPYQFGGAKLALIGLVMCYVAGILSVITFAYVITNPDILQAIADYTGQSILLPE